MKKEQNCLVLIITLSQKSFFNWTEKLTINLCMENSWEILQRSVASAVQNRQLISPASEIYALNL